MLMVGDEQTTNRQAYELFFCNMRFDLPKLKKLHTKFSAEQIEAEKKQIRRLVWTLDELFDIADAMETMTNEIDEQSLTL